MKIKKLIIKNQGTMDNKETNMDMTNEMITIRIGDIPNWLQDSFFFESLLDGSTLDEEFTLGKRFIRENNTVTTLDDFITIYNISVFFMLRNPPDSLLEFIIYHMELETYIQLDKYKHIMPDWWDIFDIVIDYKNKEFASFKFCKLGNIPMIEFYIRQGVTISQEHCIKASASNRKCLEFCIQKVPEDFNIIDCFKYAIQKKSMDCIQYLFELYSTRLIEYKEQYEDYEESSRFCITAVQFDNLDALVFLHNNGFNWNETVSLSASINSLRCLKYAVENGCPVNFMELIYVCSLPCSEYVNQKFNEQYRELLEEDDSDDEIQRPYDERPY